MNLLIGCPVSHREWILPAWFDHIRAASDTAGISAEFIFVCHPQDPSWDLIRGDAPDATMIAAPFHRGTDQRRWNAQRYEQMVDLRNGLLAGVRRAEPDLFLSLDSDILIHPDQLKFMIESVERFDAIGGRCYMTSSGTRFPSWGRFVRSGSMQRVDAEGVFGVDIIMAIKLMTPAAYAVNYALDLQGEDIGWSRNATAAGLRLGWDGRVIAKHVLAPHLLTPVDPRVGF